MNLGERGCEHWNDLKASVSCSVMGFSMSVSISNRVGSYDMWCCVTGWVASVFWRIVLPSSSSASFLLALPDPWRWRCHDPSRCWEPLIQWHRVTYPNTWVINNAAVRTSSLTQYWQCLILQNNSAGTVKVIIFFYLIFRVTLVDHWKWRLQKPRHIL
jgi:hypothetical protein